jgi:hypothetical protein
MKSKERMPTKTQLRRIVSHFPILVKAIVTQRSQQQTLSSIDS